MYPSDIELDYIEQLEAMTALLEETARKLDENLKFIDNVISREKDYDTTK